MSDEIERLKDRLNAEREWRHTYAQTCRDWLIDEGVACPDCGGSGYQTYGSTATWRGGAGGQLITQDVCCKCWGSGDVNRQWPSHRSDTTKS